mmetsp:Transcript_28107/g.71114  ORF Transcript_28107/g.71114 Transcript_28107/m.71114 type:complete len:227 (+) Transcript_28107:145-825(+)
MSCTTLPRHARRKAWNGHRLGDAQRGRLGHRLLRIPRRKPGDDGCEMLLDALVVTRCASLRVCVYDRAYALHAAGTTARLCRTICHVALLGTRFGEGCSRWPRWGVCHHHGLGDEAAHQDLHCGIRGDPLAARLDVRGATTGRQVRRYDERLDILGRRPVRRLAGRSACRTSGASLWDGPAGEVHLRWECVQHRVPNHHASGRRASRGREAGMGCSVWQAAPLWGA